jgi:hypothetical protein
MIDAPFTFVLVVGTTMCAGHSGAMLVDTRWCKTFRFFSTFFFQLFFSHKSKRLHDRGTHIKRLPGVVKRFLTYQTCSPCPWDYFPPIGNLFTSLDHIEKSKRTSTERSLQKVTILKFDFIISNPQSELIRPNKKSGRQKI